MLQLNGLQTTTLAHKQDMENEDNSRESEKNIVMLLLPRLTGSLDLHKMVTFQEEKKIVAWKS